MPNNSPVPGLNKNAEVIYDPKKKNGSDDDDLEDDELDLEEDLGGFDEYDDDYEDDEF